DRYQRALVLVRWRTYPVGQVTVPLVDGRIRGSELRDAVLNACGWILWERWLHDYLAWEEVRSSEPRPATTVAICTRDRPHDLRRCLAALMKLPDDGQEVLVIDSYSSSDCTYRVVENFPS